MSNCSGKRQATSHRATHVACCMSHVATGGFTLIEIMLGTSVMVIVLVALLGSFFGQSTLNQNSRNMLAAMNDATRIMEQIRQQNVGCSAPSARPPSQENWNGWLLSQGGGGGKSITQANTIEHIAVTCQDSDGGQDATGGAGVQDYCGSDQIGLLEWRVGAARLAFNPIRVAVAVGWRQNQRTVGGTSAGQEFAYIPGAVFTSGKSTGTVSSGSLQVTDADGNGVIESPAMLTTLVTCR